LPASGSPTFGGTPPGFSWSAQPIEPLLTATLTADTLDSAHQALGFSEVITGGWADQKQFTGTNATAVTESLWLYSLFSQQSSNWSGLSGKNSDPGWTAFLTELKNHSGLTAAHFSGIGSIATVPIPGAVWLLGSGLFGLGGMLRRRRASVAT